jgi:hypothetical protein
VLSSAPKNHFFSTIAAFCIPVYIGRMPRG